MTELLVPQACHLKAVGFFISVPSHPPVHACTVSPSQYFSAGKLPAASPNSTGIILMPKALLLQEAGAGEMNTTSCCVRSEGFPVVRSPLPSATELLAAVDMPFGSEVFLL